VRLRIMASEDREARPGETGDVQVSGPGVMLGYWRAPAATASVITDNGLERWLRTGDLGYVDDDGFLYLTGRRADLIKTGAHRVLPAAIEEAALELADVAEAAACGIPDPMLGQSVLLVVVPRRGANLTTAAVQAHCRKRLTRHMVGWVDAFAGAVATGAMRPGDPDDVTVTDPAAQYRESADRLLAAWRAGDGPDGQYRLTGDSPVPGTFLYPMMLGEYIAHGWDLAKATGQPLDWPDEGATQALESMRAMVKPEHRSPDGWVGEEVEVADDAPPLEKLVAFTGRNPAWEPPK